MAYIPKQRSPLVALAPNCAAQARDRQNAASVPAKMAMLCYDSGAENHQRPPDKTFAPPDCSRFIAPLPTPKQIHIDAIGYVRLCSSQPSTALYNTTYKAPIAQRPAFRRPQNPPPIGAHERRAPMRLHALGRAREQAPKASPLFAQLDALALASQHKDFSEWLGTGPKPHPHNAQGDNPKAHTSLEAWVARELHGWQQKVIAEEKREMSLLSDKAGEDPQRTDLLTQWHKLPKSLDDIIAHNALCDDDNLIDKLAPLLFMAPSPLDTRLALERMSEALAIAEGCVHVPSAQDGDLDDDVPHRSRLLGNRHAVDKDAKRILYNLFRAMPHTAASKLAQQEDSARLHSTKDIKERLAFAYAFKRTETRAQIEVALLGKSAQHRKALGKDIVDIEVQVRNKHISIELERKLRALVSVARQEQAQIDILLGHITLRFTQLGPFADQVLADKKDSFKLGDAPIELFNPATGDEKFVITTPAQLSALQALFHLYTDHLLICVATLREAQMALFNVVSALGETLNGCRKARLESARARLTA